MLSRISSPPAFLNAAMLDVLYITKMRNPQAPAAMQSRWQLVAADPPRAPRPNSACVSLR